jgi:hypothetical protein
MILVANGIPCRNGRKLTDGIVYDRVDSRCMRKTSRKRGQTRQGGVRGGRLRSTEVYSVCRGTWCYVEYSIFSSLTLIHYTYLLYYIQSHIRIHTPPRAINRRSKGTYSTIWSKYIHPTPNTHPGCYQPIHPLCPKWILIPTRQITKTRMIHRNQLYRYQV